MRMPVPGSPVGWYWMNSMSLSATPARYAIAIPSPVLIDPLVVKGKTRPAPPVQMITAFPRIALTLPVRSSIAAHPRQRPLPSIRRRVAKCSS